MSEEVTSASLIFHDSGKREKIPEFDTMETKVYKQQNVQEELQRNMCLHQMGNVNSSENIQNLNEKIQNQSITLQTLATRLCRELQEKEPGHKCKPCPPNWLWHANRCYLPYHIYTTWQKSEQFCADRNASLLKINNKDTVEFVKPIQLFGYWLGASPTQDSTNSMTVDQSVASSIWLKNKPSAFNGMYCAHMTSNMRIAYDDCLGLRYAICEKMAGPVRVESVLG
ncbi:C-type lectin domain family 12 member A-like [Dipodomys spectabilis]|uniref:C-type lectin domain family 12 member A-like n=1 Tax=Dipodomys spectabilis TaxID=105255 RepID=UPI001C53BFB3|nr:C-type lectin domain family 12 member A-like [Dipodomys spectabilis]